MNKLIGLLIAFFAGTLLVGTAFAAPVSSLYRSIIPENDNQFFIGTTTPSNLRYNGVFTSMQAYASSTIGAGGQATGLTISGGATTTGTFVTTSGGSVTVPAIGILTSNKFEGLYANGSGVLGLSSNGSGLSWDSANSAFYPNTTAVRDLGISLNQWRNLWLSGVATTSGLSSLASSTIGDSTQAGGLTISGGATTTGNAYFAGNVGIGSTTPFGLLSVENTSSSNSFVVGDQANDPTSFIIDNAGLVGIGIAPTKALDVNGTTRLRSSIFIDNTVIVSNSNSASLNWEFLGTNFVFNGMNIGIGTTTPTWLLNPSSATASQLALSSGAGFSQWAFRNAGGIFYLATTTVAGTATSTQAALSIDSSGRLAVGTTTLTGQLNLGVMGSTNGTSTIQSGKIQWDGYNAAGTRVCFFIVGTTPTVASGACNP